MGIKVIANNKKVYFDFFVEEEMEAGIRLVGSEVKSVREGKVSLNEGFVHITNEGEVRLVNVQIQPFFQANIQNHVTTRSRALLLNKKEIARLLKYTSQKGMTAKPLSIYLKGHLVKLKIGLCKGKKKHDKREVMKEKDTQKTMDRTKKAFNQ